MKLRRLLPLLLAAAAAPASATSTMCTYSPSDRTGYGLEFIGYGEIAMILVGLPKGPRSLPGGSYKVLEFDERARKIDLVYRNPGDPSFPPSFRLEGVGRNVLMSIDGKRLVGELNCDY
jgi:hypothetical protein